MPSLSSKSPSKYLLSLTPYFRDIEEAKREFFLVKGIGPSIKELCMRELTVSLNEQVLERNEAIKLLKQEIMDMHGR